MRKLLCVIVILFLTNSAMARNPAIYTFPNAPWATGPLINASSHVTPAGKLDFEPYYFFYDYNGIYDTHWKNIHNLSYWTHDVELYATIGLTKWMDINMNVGFLNNHCGGQSYSSIDDSVVGFDFQLINAPADRSLPSLKLGIQEVFPTGKYDHFNPKKLRTDYTGYGAFWTRFFICAGWLLHLRDHWLSLRLTADNLFPSRVRVHGYNTYGGGKGTNASVYPGYEFNMDFSYEFSLTQRWVIACDHVYSYETPQTFTGNPGILPSGQPAPMSSGSSHSFQLAPAIEYNWSEKLGVITGAYFTVAGCNANAFVSWVSAINIVF